MESIFQASFVACECGRHGDIFYADGTEELCLCKQIAKEKAIDSFRRRCMTKDDLNRILWQINDSSLPEQAGPPVDITDEKCLEFKERMLSLVQLLQQYCEDEPTGTGGNFTDPVHGFVQ